MKEAFVVLFWWVMFGGAHMVLSSPSVRPKLIARFGEWPFRGLYSLVAIATFVFLVGFYFHHKHTGPRLWRTFGPYLLARDLNLILMGFAFVLLVSGLVARPPSAMVTSGTPQAYGITRITRHPTFAAFFLFGLAHCLMNGWLTDLLFFGGFAVFSWVGATHQDARKVVEVPGYAEFKDATSFIPFGAILDRKQSLELGELRWGVIFVGLVVFYLVRAFHPTFFGGVLMTL
jgi:uncharacterized membrane protein